jgi:hypothetical protein
MSTQADIVSAAGIAALAQRIAESAAAAPQRPSPARLAAAIAKTMQCGPGPWEYYGAFDDRRCFFCGADRPSRETPLEDFDIHDTECAYRLWHELHGEHP